MRAGKSSGWRLRKTPTGYSVVADV